MKNHYPLALFASAFAILILGLIGSLRAQEADEQAAEPSLPEIAQSYANLLQNQTTIQEQIEVLIAQQESIAAQLTETESVIQASVDETRPLRAFRAGTDQVLIVTVSRLPQLVRIE